MNTNCVPGFLLHRLPSTGQAHSNAPLRRASATQPPKCGTRDSRQDRSGNSPKHTAGSLQKQAYNPHTCVPVLSSVKDFLYRAVFILNCMRFSELQETTYSTKSPLIFMSTSRHTCLLPRLPLPSASVPVWCTYPHNIKFKKITDPHNILLSTLSKTPK